MQTIKRFVYTDLQQGMVAWVIITLQKVFLSVLKCLVVFTRRKDKRPSLSEILDGLKGGF